MVDVKELPEVAAAANYCLRNKRVFVAGHRGMVGSALCRRLAQEHCDVLTAARDKVDLTRQDEVEAWFHVNKPDAVFLAAAKVGGILANSERPSEFLYENLLIEANVIKSAFESDIEKLLFLGSSCIYPKFADQPISEDALLSGSLEPTNEWYAIAKIAGLKLCQAYMKQYGARFISAMPTNLYGPGDNFDLATSHVIPALMSKIHKAKVDQDAAVVIWGTGTPRREFLHVDDLADALVRIMLVYEDIAPINVGTGRDVTIQNVAEMIAFAVGYQGGFTYDTSKPDGTPRKLLDVSKLNNLGWRSQISFREGLASTYEWYCRFGGAPRV